MNTFPEHMLALVAPAGSDLPLPKLMLALAHPDDEVLAMGARLERLRTSLLLTLTDGAPANGDDARHHGFGSVEDYREARRQELACALGLAGLPRDVAQSLADPVPDQEACLNLVRLARALAQHMLRFRPEAVLTHPYEGGHPDHDACAFATHAAVRLCSEQSSLEPIPILEAPFYHAGEHCSMRTGSFLPHIHPEEIRFVLTGEEQKNKTERLRCFHSQAETLAQFNVSAEAFRIAPAYDFTQRAHTGELFYERFPWGMKGDRFCALAGEALQALRLKKQL